VGVRGQPGTASGGRCRSPLPGAPSGDPTPITPSVEDFNNRIYNESVSLLVDNNGGPRGKVKSRFFSKTSRQIFANFFLSIPLDEIYRSAYPRPPTPIGGGARGPQKLGSAKKISHFRFPGVKIFATINCQRTSPDNSGV